MRSSLLLIAAVIAVGCRAGVGRYYAIDKDFDDRLERLSAASPCKDLTASSAPALPPPPEVVKYTLRKCLLFEYRKGLQAAVMRCQKKIERIKDEIETDKASARGLAWIQFTGLSVGTTATALGAVFSEDVAGKIALYSGVGVTVLSGLVAAFEKTFGSAERLDKNRKELSKIERTVEAYFSRWRTDILDAPITDDEAKKAADKLVKEAADYCIELTL